MRWFDHWAVEFMLAASFLAIGWSLGATMASGVAPRDDRRDISPWPPGAVPLPSVGSAGVRTGGQDLNLQRAPSETSGDGLQVTPCNLICNPMGLLRGRRSETYICIPFPEKSSLREKKRVSRTGLVLCGGCVLRRGVTVSRQTQRRTLGPSIGRAVNPEGLQGGVTRPC